MRKIGRPIRAGNGSAERERETQTRDKAGGSRWSTVIPSFRDILVLTTQQHDRGPGNLVDVRSFAVVRVATELGPRTIRTTLCTIISMHSTRSFCSLARHTRHRHELSETLTEALGQKDKARVNHRARSSRFSEKKRKRKRESRLTRHS